MRAIHSASSTFRCLCPQGYSPAHSSKARTPAANTRRAESSPRPPHRRALPLRIFSGIAFLVRGIIQIIKSGPPVWTSSVGFVNTRSLEKKVERAFRHDFRMLVSAFNDLKLRIDFCQGIAETCLDVANNLTTTREGTRAHRDLRTFFGSIDGGPFPEDRDRSLVRKRLTDLHTQWVTATSVLRPLHDRAKHRIEHPEQKEGPRFSTLSDEIHDALQQVQALEDLLHEVDLVID